MTDGYGAGAAATPDEARRRLEAILSDRLLRFNPYRVSDRELLDCAERGRWSPFPSITQMMVFHFHDIRTFPTRNGTLFFEAIYFHIGNEQSEHQFSVKSLSNPLTHSVSRLPEWTLVNGRHLVNSNIRSLEKRDFFVSHTINCDTANGYRRQAYRLHRLYGPESGRATTVRESMCAAKLTMLEELIRHATHPDYLGKSCCTFDYVTPIRKAIAAISRYPSAIPPTTHVLSK